MQDFGTQILGMREADILAAFSEPNKREFFSMKEPIPEARIEILNYLEPAYGAKDAENILELTWNKKDSIHRVWLQQEKEIWRAIHYDQIFYDSDY